jgi:hypothetical protein
MKHSAPPQNAISEPSRTPTDRLNFDQQLRTLGLAEERDPRIGKSPRGDPTSALWDLQHALKGYVPIPEDELDLESFREIVRAYAKKLKHEKLSAADDPEAILGSCSTFLKKDLLLCKLGDQVSWLKFTPHQQKPTQIINNPFAKFKLALAWSAGRYKVVKRVGEQFIPVCFVAFLSLFVSSFCFGLDCSACSDNFLFLPYQTNARYFRRLLTTCCQRHHQRIL